MSEEEKKSILEQHYIAKHKNSIKIDESQLEDIVKKALNEQSFPGTSSSENMGYRSFSTPQNPKKDIKPKEDINPKKLKLGDGGKLNPKLIPDVRILQQKLIDLGLLKTKTGKPTGFFGELTDLALKTYYSGKVDSSKMSSKEKTALPPLLTTTQSAPSDYLGKGGQFERELYGGMSQEQYLKFIDQLSKYPPASKLKLPLHLRAFMDYLMGRTTPLTAADLTREEQDFLKIHAISQSKKRLGFNYDYWKSVGAGNLPTAITSSGSKKEKDKLKKSGQGSLLNPGLTGAFMYTLGEISPNNIKVSPSKDKVTVIDNYDMNVKEYGLSKEQIIKNFTDAVSGYFGGKVKLYPVIRNAAAFKEMSGYPGYPVNITV
jgi:hypothetical protein